MTTEQSAAPVDAPQIPTDVRPQDDLYFHINGEWIASHTIPDDRSADGVIRQLFDTAEEKVRDIILHAGEIAASATTASGGDPTSAAEDGVGCDPLAVDVEVEDALASADLVVTGEGRFDRQTLHGKGPGAVIDRAHQTGVPVWVVCGATELTAEDATGVTGIIELRSLAPAETCMTRPAPVVKQAGERLADLLRA